MLGKVGYASVLLMLFVVEGSIDAFAQNADTSIIGFWEQTSDSVFIEIVEVGGVLSAEVVRNDWNPVLVGKTIWQDLKSDDGKKWTGEVVAHESSDVKRSGKKSIITLNLRRKDQLSSMEKPGKRKRVKWKRSAPVKKGY